MSQSVALYKKIYAEFQAPVSRFDCGAKCAPLNGGVPVCCDIEQAIPLADKHEVELLYKRSDLWRPFRANDAASKHELKDKHADCRAIQCKGARFCERDNRSLACRAFPFFPYITAGDELVGLAPFWTYEDRCWVMSNLQIVDRRFAREFIAAHEALFAADPEERKANAEQSAAMRRVFSRWNRIIPLIGREGERLKVMPRSHAIRPAHWREYVRHETFRKEAPAPARKR